METTDWFDHEPVELTNSIASSPDTIPQEFTNKIQWADPDTPLDGYTAGDVTALATMLGNTSNSTSDNHPLDQFASVAFDNNWSIRSHWFWHDIFTDGYSMDVGRFLLVDPTGRTWRNSQISVLIDEWEAAHPGKLVGSFEWESDDNVGVLGSWSDRRIIFNPTAYDNGGWVVEWSNYEEGEGELPFRQTVPGGGLFIPPHPEIAAYAPPAEGGLPALWGGSAAELENLRFSPDGVLPFYLGGMNVAMPEVTVAVPDDVFEDRAIPLTVPLGSGPVQEQTNGMVIWALPDMHTVVDSERVLVADLPIANLHMVSVYHPPRWRVNWFSTATPFRHIYPTRGDGREGGARQVYPPPKAMQSGHQTVGGIQ